ncbi:TPA: hypothetical protein ACFU2Q_000341 [Neisseria subflava]|jgi:hypothetical protein|nr:MAG TPA: ferric uptake regulation protein [Caudoviricetes sp.]
MGFDYSLAKILENGRYTPSEIKDLLEEQGFSITLPKLTEHLNLQVALGIAHKREDGTFTALPV